MVSPLSSKQLEFSTPDGASHDCHSVRRKSQRMLASKRAASDEAGAEEKSKKRRVKKEKSASSVNNRTWNSGDEVILLKGVADYRSERGKESYVEWEAFYPFVGDSLTAKFSKEQIMGKIRKMKSSFLDHHEKIKQGNDSHSITFSNPEAFEIAMNIWGKNETKKDMPKENEEALGENEAAENENSKEAQHSESGEEVLKEQNKVANAQQVNNNGAKQNERDKELLQEENEVAEALKTVEKVIAERATEIASHGADDGLVKPSEKEKHDAHVEFCNVQDAFDTLISHDLSDHRKRVQLEMLKKLGSEMRRKLSQEWTAICDRERKLKIRKFKFSATLAEAAKET